MKLNPDDLNVTSFTTSDGSGERLLTTQYPVITIPTVEDPTAATRCFICPPFSWHCVTLVDC